MRAIIILCVKGNDPLGNFSTHLAWQKHKIHKRNLVPNVPIYQITNLAIYRKNYLGLRKNEIVQWNLLLLMKLGCVKSVMLNPSLFQKWPWFFKFVLPTHKLLILIEIIWHIKLKQK